MPTAPTDRPEAHAAQRAEAGVIGRGREADGEHLDAVRDSRTVDRLPDCTCDAPGTDEHYCPYRAELYDDFETMCWCCPACTRECMRSI